VDSTAVSYVHLRNSFELVTLFFLFAAKHSQVYMLFYFIALYLLLDPRQLEDLVSAPFARRHLVKFALHPGPPSRLLNLRLHVLNGVATRPQV